MGNCDQFLAFCNTQSLVVEQTQARKEQLGLSDAWVMWRHPATGRPHLKDLILVPISGRRILAETNAAVFSDHSMVVGRLPRGASGGGANNRKRVIRDDPPSGSSLVGGGSTRARLHNLDMYADQ
jgi:hypothetical protein